MTDAELGALLRQLVQTLMLDRPVNNIAPSPESEKPNVIIADRKVLIDDRRAAEYLGLERRTLQQWRVNGGGPKFIRLSRRCVRYRVSDLDDWTERRRVANTSQKVPGWDD